MDMNQSNVVEFKRTAKANHVKPNNQAAKPNQKAARSGKLKRAAFNAALFTGLGVLGVLRYTLFFILSILRGPIRALCGLAAFASMIAIPLVFFGVSSSEAWKITALVSLFVLLIGTSTLMWFYDVLLLKIAPQQIMLTN